MNQRLCTPDNPFTPERDRDEPGGGWAHEGAYEKEDSQRDNYLCGDTVIMICPNCNARWKMELPQ